MSNVLSNIIPIFLITLIGAVIRRRWLKSDEFWLCLEKLSYFFLFPVALFHYASNVNCGSLGLSKLLFAIILSTLIVAALLVYYQHKTNYDKVQFTSIFQGSIRYNTYIFLGVTGPIFGVYGLSVASMISSCMIIFTNIISVMVFSYYIHDNSISHNHRESAMLMAKLVVKNPLIIASVTGCIFNYYDIELNFAIRQTISNISHSALAICLLNVGASLRFVTQKALFRDIAIASIVKLVILPIVTLIVLTALSITGISKSIGILYSCLPCASSAFILSRQLGGDPESMASIITFTTILSIFSLSIFMYFMY